MLLQLYFKDMHKCPEGDQVHVSAMTAVEDHHQLTVDPALERMPVTSRIQLWVIPTTFTITTTSSSIHFTIRVLSWATIRIQVLIVWHVMLQNWGVHMRWQQYVLLATSNITMINSRTERFIILSLWTSWREILLQEMTWCSFMTQPAPDKKINYFDGMWQSTYHLEDVT